MAIIVSPMRIEENAKAMPEFTVIRERDPDAELLELEQLWAASPRSESRLRPLLGRVSPHLGKVLALGWLTFLASLYFEPAPNPGAVTPTWADFLIAGLFLSLGTAGLTGSLRSVRVGFAAATAAGVFGLALAIGCMTTDHHPGSWWAYELGATSLLLGLSTLGLRRTLRR